MSFNLRHFGLTTLLAGSLFGVALALQEAAPGAQPPAPPLDPAMEAWMKKMEPGAEHVWLDRFAGDYAVKCKMWLEPGKPPAEFSGEARIRRIMDGRFLQERFESDFQGQVFQGLGLTGFDTVKGKFTSSWVDTQSTFITQMEGSADAAANTLKLQGEVPQLEGAHKMRIEWRSLPDGGHVCEFFDTNPAGTESKSMEFTYSKIATATRFGKKGKGDGN
jgi:Protein of unknown function (DUF1579)